jgi:hypothetical protein
MYPAIKKVVPRNDYTLYLAFDNGREGVLDIKPILDFGVFRRIKEPEEFKRVRISFDTVEWECGVDLDPEYAYAKCEEGAIVEL